MKIARASLLSPLHVVVIELHWCNGLTGSRNVSTFRCRRKTHEPKFSRFISATRRMSWPRMISELWEQKVKGWFQDELFIFIRTCGTALPFQNFLKWSSISNLFLLIYTGLDSKCFNVFFHIYTSSSSIKLWRGVPGACSREKCFFKPSMHILFMNHPNGWKAWKHMLNWQWIALTRELTKRVLTSLIVAFVWTDIPVQI